MCVASFPYLFSFSPSVKALSLTSGTLSLYFFFHMPGCVSPDCWNISFFFWKPPSKWIYFTFSTLGPELSPVGALQLADVKGRSERESGMLLPGVQLLQTPLSRPCLVRSSDLIWTCCCWWTPGSTGSNEHNEAWQREDVQEFEGNYSLLTFGVNKFRVCEQFPTLAR